MLYCLDERRDALLIGCGLTTRSELIDDDTRRAAELLASEDRAERLQRHRAGSRTKQRRVRRR